MADETVAESGGNYTTLASAMADAGREDGDTITITGTWSVADTAAVTVQDDNQTITADANSAHAGKETGSPTYYRLAVGAAHCITMGNDVNGQLIEKFVILQTGTGSSDEGLRTANNTFTLRNLIFRATGASGADQDGIHQGGNNATVTIEQCYFTDFRRGGITKQSSGTSTININSCGIYNCGGTDGTEDGGITANHSGTVTWNIHNTWAVGNSGTNAADFQETAGTNTYNISNCIDGDNSIAGIVDTSEGTNFASRAISETTAGGDEIMVQEKDTAPYDLTLRDDSTNNDAQEVHTDSEAEGLTIPTTDIAGTTRNSAGSPVEGTNYDIGPFEVVAAAASGAGIFRHPLTRQPLLHSLLR